MRCGAAAIVLAVAAAASPPAFAAGGAAEARLTIPRFDRAAELYARNCQGCHGHTGVSVDEVPDLRDRVGWFLHTDQGRDYIVRVPGVAFAPIDDEMLALTLNWMLETFSARQLPEGWSAFTADEVGRLRRRPVANIQSERGAVVEQLVRRGVIPDAQSISFGAEADR
jgi:hypothetical protein